MAAQAARASPTTTPATGVRAGDHFTPDLFARLLDEEYAKLLAASDRDVHDDSKATTLPIAREIVEAYVLEPVKAPWYIDLLNLNLDNHDLAGRGSASRTYLDGVREGRDAHHREPRLSTARHLTQDSTP